MKPTGALVIDAMLTRRSVQPLAAPGPTDDELTLLMRAAITVPDHGGLRPWRLIVVSGDARAEFGAALADAALANAPHLPPATLRRIADKAFAVNVGQREYAPPAARPEVATLSDVVRVLQSDGTQIPLRFGGCK